MSKQASLDLSSKSQSPVECLGQSFPTDEARREHYLKLLAEKLKDPDFRKIEGFPIGEDEDILALSDPPYYTACPNPWIGEFIQHYGQLYEPQEKHHREPFAADVSEGKNHPIYNAHSYHTKVPHRAIMRYILHYTEPGDVIFDGFCGTGMTGVAAQLCGDRKEVQELGYRVDANGLVYDEGGKAVSKLGIRRAVMNDLSPAATFITSTYNGSPPSDHLISKAKAALAKCEQELGRRYETKHPKDNGIGSINYIVWSDIFSCPECGSDLRFWDLAVDLAKGAVRDSFKCSGCSTEVTKRTIKPKNTKEYDPFLRKTVTKVAQYPAFMVYTYQGKRYEKTPDSEDVKQALEGPRAEDVSCIPTALILNSAVGIGKLGLKS